MRVGHIWNEIFMNFEHRNQSSWYVEALISEIFSLLLALQSIFICYHARVPLKLELKNNIRAGCLLVHWMENPSSFEINLFKNIVFFLLYSIILCLSQPSLSVSWNSRISFSLFSAQHEWHTFWHISTDWRVKINRSNVVVGWKCSQKLHIETILIVWGPREQRKFHSNWLACWARK